MSIGRPIDQVVRGEHFHWVGDGFRVTNLFPSGANLGSRISPFLMLDHHAPYSSSRPSRTLRHSCSTGPPW